MKQLKIFLSNNNRNLLLIFILAFTVRILLAAFIPYPFYPVKVDDAHKYDVMASNILHGKGFSADEAPPYRPTIWRTPVYPIFLAGVYAVFGQRYDVVRIIQALIDSITCLLVYFIFLLCFKNGDKYNWPAVTAYFLAALCPFTAFFVSMLYSETLTTFLITLSAFLFLLAINKKKLIYYFASGIIIALAFLCRPAMVIYPFILIACFFLINMRSDKKAVSKCIGAYVIAIILVWMPWIYRNYISFHRFLPLSIGSGTFMWIGSYPPNRHEKDAAVDISIFLNEYYKVEGTELLDVDSKVKKEALEKIKKQPFQYIKYTIKRIPLLCFSSYSHYIQIDKSFAEIISEIRISRFSEGVIKATVFLLIKSLLTIFNFMLILAGVLGIIFAARFWSSAYPILILPIYIVLIHAPLGQANPRYFMPAWPFLLVFAGYAAWTMSRFKERVWN